MTIVVSQKTEDLVLLVFILEFTLLLLCVFPIMYKIYKVLRSRDIQLLPRPPIQQNSKTKGTQTGLSFPMDLGPPYDPGYTTWSTCTERNSTVDYIELDPIYQNVC